MGHGFELYIPRRINHLVQKPHLYPLDNFFHSFRFSGESRGVTYAAVPLAGRTRASAPPSSD